VSSFANSPFTPTKPWPITGQTSFTAVQAFDVNLHLRHGGCLLITLEDGGGGERFNRISSEDAGLQREPSPPQFERRTDRWMRMRPQDAEVSCGRDFLREPPKNQDALLADGVDDLTNLLVMEEQRNKLSDIEVTHGDRSFIARGDDQIPLAGPFQLYPPNGNPIDATVCGVRLLKIGSNQYGCLKCCSGEIRPGEVCIEENRPDEECPSEVCPGKICSREICLVRNTL
jgi:hypothetical protein